MNHQGDARLKIKAEVSLFLLGPAELAPGRTRKDPHRPERHPMSSVSGQASIGPDLFALAVHEAAYVSRQDLEKFLISQGLDQDAARDLSIRAYWRSMIMAGQIRTWSAP
jgi:hypothetical protein